MVIGFLRATETFQKIRAVPRYLIGPYFSDSGSVGRFRMIK
jgi:hypothetical protein